MESFFMDTLIYLRATGTELERMMNLCVNRSVFLYDIKKKDDGTRNEVEFSVKPSDYFKMHSILRKTHTRTVILKKSGLPFFVMKMKIVLQNIQRKMDSFGRCLF